MQHLSLGLAPILFLPLNNTKGNYFSGRLHRFKLRCTSAEHSLSITEFWLHFFHPPTGLLWAALYLSTERVCRELRFFVFFCSQSRNPFISRPLWTLLLCSMQTFALSAVAFDLHTVLGSALRAFANANVWLLGCSVFVCLKVFFSFQGKQTVKETQPVPNISVHTLVLCAIFNNHKNNNVFFILGFDQNHLVQSRHGRYRSPRETIR